MFRTHTCGELRPAQVGQTVTLSGWVDSYRDQGKGLFIDLRDRYGITQIAVNPPHSSAEILALSKTLRCEYVIQVTGEVANRPAGQANPRHATGEIELRCAKLVVLNVAKTPPFLPTQQGDLPSEELRLKHRYLDLRRTEMQRVLFLRDRMIKTMRDYCAELDFVDVETPMLGRSTPEGARDYLVPSRVHKDRPEGAFYALPQSPQLYKQILMIAGFDRYVQVARCFRDEDLRADRQPEFTQLDLEMSFVDSNDVMSVIEGLMVRVARETLGIEVQTPFARLTWDESMERFGHDAPDLRYGMELIDCTDIAAQCDFKVFRSVADSGGKVRGVNAPGAAEKFSRKAIDDLTEYVKQQSKAKGLAWFKVDADGKLTSTIAKNFSDATLAQIGERMQAKPGDLLLFVADEWATTCEALHRVRKKLGAELNLYDPKTMHFSWVVEFPMFAQDEETGGWAAMHHPFTAPRPQDLEFLSTDPAKCRAQAYDLVINGYEAGGGTIRIHDQGVQQQVFDILGLDRETAAERFGFLLDALQYGAPPHGGIALGIDRCVMLFGSLDNIRDCIAFPKTQKAADLMTGAPGEVDLKQLREIGVRLDR